jgi:hypothetical protein
MTRRLAPVLLVLALAPVTAEYLIGYDDTLTNPAALIFGVLLFGPIYGAPAVLIRESVVRRRRGWGSILLLAVAFGLIQAGLVDQSMFDPDYRDIPYWQSMRVPTYLPWAGTSVYMVLTFVAGHVFGSIAAPIAAAQSWWPERRDEPWLGPVGLTVVLGLWLFGAWFVLQDQLSATSFRISPAQGIGTVAAVVILVAIGLWARTPVPRRSTRPAPVWWVVALVTAALLTVRSVVPTGWAGTLLAAVAIVSWLVLMVRWTHSPGWSGVHVVGALVGDLLSIGGPAFGTTPLGDPSLAAKLVANTVLLGLVLGVAAVSYRRETTPTTP